MSDNLDQIRNLENDNAQCQNCIDTVYMDDLGGGFYRCPVCGDERDTRYPQSAPFADYSDQPEPDYDIPSPREPGVFYGDEPDPDGVS